MPLKTVNIRLKFGGQIKTYDCSHIEEPLKLSDWVLVESEQGPVLGRVTRAPLMLPRGGPGPEAPGVGLRSEAASGQEPSEGKPGRRQKHQAFKALRRVIRVATPDDLAVEARHQLKEREVLEYCGRRAQAHGLQMNLVAAEVLFDDSKIIIYYTADERVDFRALVKELVSRFRNRIEMRQIGVRHESRMIGGLGGCGLSFCCAGFLNNFAPVSVKMAKEQNLSLNPAKISGVCGRLMCCLAYEYQAYMKQKAGLPKLGKLVRTPAGEGRVIRQNLIDRISIVLSADGTEYELKHEPLPADENDSAAPAAAAEEACPTNDGFSGGTETIDD